VVTETQPGILRLARVSQTFEAEQGFLAVQRTEHDVLDLAGGTAESVQEGDGFRITLKDAAGKARVRLDVSFDLTGLLARPVLLPDAAEFNEIRFRLRCGNDESFHGFGGQNNAVDHRGSTIPIRSTEQGLGKDPELGEGDFSYQGHLHDTYFPLPYTLVTTSGPEARAHGLLLESSHRSRFLVCSEESDVLEIQVDTNALDGLRVLAGPTPRDVVRQFTDHHGRPNPVPDWAFGPWVAIQGMPLPVAEQADELDEHDIPLSTVWHQDFRDYADPDMPAMIDKFHGMGLRVLTYFNPFLDNGRSDWEELRSWGCLPQREDGTPYDFPWYDMQRSFVDFTNPEAWDWMVDRLEFAWDLGLDGWMADYGEWVIPDMVFHNGMDGWQYGNLYTVDWARINWEVMQAKRPDGDGVIFSRSGFLGSNRVLSVTWAGDQQTDWDLLDGIGSVIPYGTGLGLSGLSAFGHDIAGYTGIISPASTKELYFRWTQFGAWSPIMRTHRGNAYQYNWNWNRDADTIAQFRSYALLHLRMLPYLTALHAEAMESGLPAMRAVLLEFPEWEGARDAVHEYLLGPAFLVAPVIQEGATTRDVRLPPGRWYRFPEGTAVEGDKVLTENAPMDRIPVFIRAGGVAVMLPDTVRRAEPVPGKPDVPAASELALRQLEILVGAGRDGELLLSDGTRVTARMLGEPSTSAAMDACGSGDDPWVRDCIGQEGLTRAVPRTGPGMLVAGGMQIEIMGGPAERRYVARVFDGVE
jgi:alpha-glucosidase (family GH31 glycosyl hydrolase)